MNLGHVLPLGVSGREKRKIAAAGNAVGSEKMKKKKTNKIYFPTLVISITIRLE